MKRVILTADDFGLSEAVNEGIERAHRDGILTSASLMVAAPAADDAVRRARAMPDLHVGLHLVVIEGPAALPPRETPDLVDKNGRFDSNQLRRGIGYFADPRIRRELAAEIHAQFEAFAATGLALDHADAHKHMQLHPTVGRLLIGIGKAYGLPAVRTPAEPPAIMASCGASPSFGDRALYAWSTLFRRQARRAGLTTNDHVFGLAWSGHMTEDRLLRLIPHLPDGLNEIYFHPATGRDPTLDALMPEYEHAAELATLLSPALCAAMDQAGVIRTGYSDIARANP